MRDQKTGKRENELDIEGNMGRFKKQYLKNRKYF